MHNYYVATKTTQYGPFNTKQDACELVEFLTVQEVACFTWAAEHWVSVPNNNFEE